MLFLDLGFPWLGNVWEAEELEKRSLDPYKIHSSEILDLGISLDCGHEYLIFQLGMMKNLAKTDRRIRRGSYF